MNELKDDSRTGRLVASIDLDAMGAGEAVESEDDLDAALRARLEKADRQIDSFVNEALNVPQDGPDAHAQDNADLDAEDGDVPTQRRRRWEQQMIRVVKMAEDNAQFGEQARQYVWSIYIRQKKIQTIDDAIFAFIMASRYYDLVKNKIAEQEFWPVFFEKIGYAVTNIKDEFHGALLDHMILQGREVMLRIVYGVETLAEWAHAQSAGAADEADSARDPRSFVRALFTEPRPTSEKSLFDQMRVGLPREVMDRCARALAEMDGEVAPQKKKDFNPEAMFALIRVGKKGEAVDYLRRNARSVEPGDIETAFEEKGVDLFRLDILGTAKEERKNGKSALLHGALVNHYSKTGMFNLEYAKHKLLREKGRVSQGRVDERGWNNYMQLAARPDFNPAFIENEHEFWDHMFKQMAHFRYKRPGNTRALRELELEVARDLLDRPAKNGMPALHIAARAGNAVVVKYVLTRLISFYFGNALKQAQQRGLDADKLAELRKRQGVEMRENFNYLTGVDQSGMNVFMHAIVANQADVAQLLVGHFQEHPEYLEILSQVKVPLDDKTVTLVDFASRDYGFGRNTEGSRLLQRVLKDAGDRLRARQQGARVA